MTLSRDGASVRLEPKVLDVLIYFYENGNRYISMTELHEKVWHDRVVSDAAVRRIIGKLRVLFDDDHKAPTYIQSLPKRGYKLICKTSNPHHSQTISKSHSPQAITKNNPAHKTAGAYIVESYEEMGWVDKVLQWKGKTLISILLLVVFLFFVVPLIYRVSDIL